MDDGNTGTDLGFNWNDLTGGSGGSAGGGILGQLLGGVNVGGLISSGQDLLAGKQNSQLAQQMMNQITQNYQQQQQYNRPNQISDFGSSTWAKDPTTGAYTQTLSLNPQDQANLNAMRGVSAQRLGAAGGIDLSQYSKSPDWNSIGLGKLAAAAGVQPGGTTDSMGGVLLKGPHTYTAPNAYLNNGWQAGTPSISDTLIGSKRI